MAEEHEKTPDWKGYGWDQIEVERLVRATWGDKSFDSANERCARLHEEAAELFQSVGGTREVAHGIVDMVFDKKPGDLPQEIGGVTFTLLGLCALKGLRLDDVLATELARFRAKDPQHFRDKQKLKADLGVSIRPE